MSSSNFFSLSLHFYRDSVSTIQISTRQRNSAIQNENQNLTNDYMAALASVSKETMIHIPIIVNLPIIDQNSALIKNFSIDANSVPDINDLIINENQLKSLGLQLSSLSSDTEFAKNFVLRLASYLAIQETNTKSQPVMRSLSFSPDFNKLQSQIGVSSDKNNVKQNSAVTTNSNSGSIRLLDPNDLTLDANENDEVPKLILNTTADESLDLDHEALNHNALSPVNPDKFKLDHTSFTTALNDLATHVMTAKSEESPSSPDVNSVHADVFSIFQSFRSNLTQSGLILHTIHQTLIDYVHTNQLHTVDSEHKTTGNIKDYDEKTESNEFLPSDNEEKAIKDLHHLAKTILDTLDISSERNQLIQAQILALKAAHSLTNNSNNTGVEAKSTSIPSNDYTQLKVLYDHECDTRAKLQEENTIMEEEIAKLKESSVNTSTSNVSTKTEYSQLKVLYDHECETRAKLQQENTILEEEIAKVKENGQTIAESASVGTFDSKHPSASSSDYTELKVLYDHECDTRAKLQEENTILEEEITKLKQNSVIDTSASIKNEYSQLKVSYDHECETRAKLQEENTILEEEITKLKENSATSSKNPSSNNNDFEQLKVLYDHECDTRAKLQAENTILEEEIAKFKDNLASESERESDPIVAQSILSYATEIDSLLSTKQTQVTKITELETSLSIISNKANSLEAQYKELEAKYHNLQTDSVSLSDMEKTAVDLHSLTLEIKEHREALDAMTKSKKEQQAQFQTQRAEWIETIQNHESELNQMKSDLKLATNNYNAATKTISELTENSKHSTETIANNNSNIAELQTEIIALNKQINEFKAQNEQLHDDHSTLHEALNQAKNSSNNENNDLTSTISKLNDEITQLKLQHSNDINTQLQAKQIELQSQAEKKQAAIQEELDQLKRDKMTSQKELEKVKQSNQRSISELQDEFTVLKEKYENQETHLNNKIMDYDKLKVLYNYECNTRAKLQDECTINEEQLNELKQSNTEQELHIEQLKQRILTLETELQENNSNHSRSKSNIESSLNLHKQQVNQLNDDNNMLKQQLLQSKSEISRLNNENRVLQQENSNMNNRYNELIQENKKLEKIPAARLEEAERDLNRKHASAMEDLQIEMNRKFKFLQLENDKSIQLIAKSNLVTASQSNEINELTHKLNQYQSERKSLLSTQQSLELDVEKLHKKLKHSELSNIELNSQINNLQMKYNALNNNYNNLTLELHTMTKLNHETEFELNKLKSINQRTFDNILQHQLLEDSRSSNSHNNEEMIETLQSEIEQYREKHNEIVRNMLEKYNGELELLNDKYEKKCDDLERLYTLFGIENINSNNPDQLYDKIRSLFNNKTNELAELKSSQELIDSQHQHINQITEQYNELLKEIQILRQKKQEHNKEKIHLQKTIQKLIETNEQLQKTLKN